MKQIKPTYYDDFSCIADRCSINCCQEWKIEVDKHTKKKWSNLKLKNENKSIDSYVKKKDGTSIIGLNEKKECPFLNDKKLCNLVMQFGDEVLSKTCTTFPRQVKDFGDRTEVALMTSCPEVIDVLQGLEDVSFIHEEEWKDSLVKVRTFLMEIVKKQEYTCEKSMMICFYLLLDLYEKESITDAVIEEYKKQEVMNELSEAIDKMQFSSRNTLDENNELFLDLAVNYRKEQLYTGFLEPIAKLAAAYCDGDALEDIEVIQKEFGHKFSEYEGLFRNYLITELFNNCLSPEGDLESMIVQFQWMALEYVIIRHTIFLQWMAAGKRELSYEQVRDSIVIVSRMTGYEEEDIIEYLENSFQDIVWDWGYLALLVGKR